MSTIEMIENNFDFDLENSANYKIICIPWYLLDYSFTIHPPSHHHHHHNNSVKYIQWKWRWWNKTIAFLLFSLVMMILTPAISSFTIRHLRFIKLKVKNGVHSSSYSGIFQHIEENISVSLREKAKEKRKLSAFSFHSCQIHRWNLFSSVFLSHSHSTHCRRKREFDSSLESFAFLKDENEFSVHSFIHRKFSTKFFLLRLLTITILLRIELKSSLFVVFFLLILSKFYFQQLVQSSRLCLFFFHNLFEENSTWILCVSSNFLPRMK